MQPLDKNIKRKYSFLPYDPNWVTKFESIKETLTPIFGDKAIQIEHMGSTSIPGMMAKPLIDILIIVKNVHDLSEQIEKMTETGYECGENYIAPNTLIFFKLGPDGEKLENIHVCEADSFKAKQFLTMRNFLRAFPEKAKTYSDLKAMNFNKYPEDYPAYRSAKKPFLDQIEKEAYEWAETNSQNI
jgi:GrpB-like predicted nucleotidyltransferase (UPF0157 family)